MCDIIIYTCFIKVIMAQSLPITEALYSITKLSITKEDQTPLLGRFRI